MIGNGSNIGGGDGGAVADWAELTQECLLNILSRLTLEQRWRGPMLVCKSWLAACKDPTLHTKLDLESLFDSVSGGSSRWWAPEFQRKIDSMLNSVVSWSGGANLEEIRIRHCSDRSLSLAAERCRNLKILWVKSCPKLTDASITQVAYNCSQLIELDISYCYEISDKSMAMIGRNCPNLTVLKRNLMNRLDPSQDVGFVPDEYLKSCPQDGDSEARAIGKFMPKLGHLEIRFSNLTVKGLESICSGCLELEYLDLSGCTKLTRRDVENETLRLEKLKQVKKPNSYIPRSFSNTERYGHWRLYDERFQTNAFRI